MWIFQACEPALCTQRVKFTRVAGGQAQAATVWNYRALLYTEVTILSLTGLTVVCLQDIMPYNAENNL